MLAAVRTAGAPEFACAPDLCICAALKTGYCAGAMMLDDVCLFAHFDRDDVVDDHVLRYLRAIRSCGFFVVVISTSKLNDSWIARLRSVVQEVILRDNTGHDFGSWELGLQHFGDRIGGRLLLANDSVYAPVGSLADSIHELTSVPADAYGMTMSAEIAPHLQSWFLLLNKRVHAQPRFRAVFAQNFGGLEKPDIVRRGEVQLSQTLMNEGFRLHALFDGLPNVDGSFNCCHVLWREMVEDQGVPFIKVELLRHNPLKMPNVERWREVVAKKAPDLVDLIERHLQRLAAGANEYVPPELPVFRRSLYSFIAASYDEHRHGRTATRSARRHWARARLLAFSWSYRAWCSFRRRVESSFAEMVSRGGGG